MRDTHFEKQVSDIVAALKQARMEQKLSHEEIAKRTGLSRPAISFIENGKRNPTLLSCLKIAKALNIKLDDIIQKTEKP